MLVQTEYKECKKIDRQKEDWENWDVFSLALLWEYLYQSYIQNTKQQIRNY